MGEICMRKKVFIVCVIFFFLILFFCLFKKIFIGNNKVIGNIDELDKYIMEIEDYKLLADVSVFSNKNMNTYKLSQFHHGSETVCEIYDQENRDGLIITNNENKVTVKNTSLNLEKVFELYSETAENSVGLDSFIKDYKADDKKEFLDKDECYIVRVKSKNSQNKYSKSKEMYFNKEKNCIDKIIVKDINNNDQIIIKYNTLEIL